MSIDFTNLPPWANMRRCNLSDNGIVNAYFGDPTFKDDGSNGQVMVEIPKFYYQKVSTDIGYTFGISDQPEIGFVIHPAFFRDRNGDGIAEEVNYRYCSAYEGVLHDGTSYVTGNTTADNNASVTSSWKLCSVSGYKPYCGLNIGNFRTIAQRRGNGWGITDFNLLSAVQMLYLVEYGHFDSQTKIGQGFTASGNTASIITGKTSFLGNITGNESNIGTDGVHAMSYRGMENLYGNLFKWIDGLVTEANTIKIGSVGFNDTGVGYSSYSVTFANAGGYCSDIWNESEFGFIGKIFTGSATTKMYDWASMYAGSIFIFGGFYASVTKSGSFFLDASTSNYSNALIASRLSF